MNDIVINGLPDFGLGFVLDYLRHNGFQFDHINGNAVPANITGALPAFKVNRKTVQSNTRTGQLIVEYPYQVDANEQLGKVVFYCDPWDYVDYATRAHGKSRKASLLEWNEFYARVLEHKPSNLVSSLAVMQQPLKLLELLNNKFGYDFNLSEVKTGYSDFINKDRFNQITTIENIRYCKENLKTVEVLQSLHATAILAHDVVVINAQKKLDIIIPCYNLGQFILDTLAGLERSLANNFEVYIIDDGSTSEESKAGLRKAEELGYHVMWEVNRGLCDALNFAIAKGSNPYLLILSADDYLDPKFINQSIALLENNSALGVVYTNPKTFGTWYSMWLTPDFDEVEFLSRNFIIATSTFRRSYWEKSGGYDKKANGNEDWEMWMSCLEQGAVFHHIDEYLFSYRFRHGSKIQHYNLPQNRKELVAYMAGKHKSLYEKHADKIVANLHYAISDIEIRQIGNIPQEMKSADQLDLERGFKVLGTAGTFIYKFVRKVGYLNRRPKS